MTLNGIDISHWQTADASKNVAYDFMICKATEGTGFVDNTCATHMANAKAKGKLRGVYHFANAHKNPGQAGAIKEADFFLKNVAGWIGDAVLILDWEADSVKQGPQWAKWWLDHVYAKTGVRPWFYTYRAALNSAYSILTDYPLWLAAYGSNAVGGYRPGSATGSYAPWKTITCFQYGSNGQLPGYAQRLDLDVFYGDAATWNKLAGKDSTAPPPPVAPPSNSYVNVAAKLPVIDLSNPNSVAQGKDVTTLQGLLLANWEGPAGLVGGNQFPDGVAGASTRAALIAFQEHTGLDPDGKVGPATWAKLLNQ